MAAKNPPLSILSCSPIRDRRKRFCSSTRRSRPIYSNFFNFEDIRYSQDFMPEAHQLMNYLTSQAAIPEYQVRLKKWRTDTVAMWDNLQVQHYAVADYGNAPKMLRATLTGTPAGLSRRFPPGNPGPPLMRDRRAVLERPTTF